jgi:hypothetical protein
MGLSCRRRPNQAGAEQAVEAGISSSQRFGLLGKHTRIAECEDSYPLHSYTFGPRPREWGGLGENERAKLVSLADVFRRIPELQPLIEECLGLEPLSFHVGYASKNWGQESARTKAYIQKTGNFALTAPPDGPTKITYAAIYPHGQHLTKAYLESLNLPFKNIQEEVDRLSGSRHFVGEVAHPSADIWWEHIRSYKSGYCGTSVVVPLWGVVDDLADDDQRVQSTSSS